MEHVRVDSGRKMPIQAHMLPAFAAILAVIAAGTMNLSWWAAGAGACTLALTSLTSTHSSFARCARAGSSIVLPVILLSIVFNTAAAATAAFGLGRLIGWCWGL